MLENIKVFTQSSICISGTKKLYFDPYGVPESFHDADIILITHSHYDHFSIEDILKVKHAETILIAPSDVIQKLGAYFTSDYLFAVKPNQTLSVKGISIMTVPAYNDAKDFHPKVAGWVGYVVILDDVTYYVAGDTDAIKENETIKCDVALVPIGGTFTMNSVEAAQYVNLIHPQYAIPTHYGSIVGVKEDEKVFLEHLSSDILGIIKL